MSLTPPTTVSMPPPPPDVADIIRKADQQSRHLTALKEATSSFLRRDARLGQFREKTLLLRSRAKFEWKNCYDYRRFVQESFEAFNDEAATSITMAAAEDHDERLSRLRKSHEQVIRDFEAQNEYAERSNALQTELSGVEHELQMKEVSVKEAADTIRRILGELILPENSAAATAVETDAPPSTASEKSEELDPLIDNYFQKAGAVNDLVNQSRELQVDYTEARTEREFRIERGDIVEVADELFETLWQSRRENNAEKLSEARRMADTARAACIDNGLDPDQHRRRPLNDSDRSVSDSQPDQISRMHLPTIQIVEDGDYPDGRSDSDHGISGYQVITPEDYHASNTKSQVAAPLADRVLNWIQGTETQITPDIRPRRSLSISSPPRQSFPPEPFTSPASNALQGIGFVDVAPGSLRESGYEMQRRRSSDSNMKALEPKYHTNPQEFVEDLKRRKP